MTFNVTSRVRAAALAVAVLAIGPLGARAADVSARDLVKKMRESAPKVAFVAQAKLISDRGWTRELEMSYKHLQNDVDAGYMEVTAPMDLKDTRFLVLDRANGRDEQWIYVPAAKRAIRVGDQTRKQDFLGSEFSVGDLVHPDLDAFTYSYVGEEDVAGRHCKLVEAVPKTPADEPYSKSVFAIDPTDLLAVKAQFFDAHGQPYKVLTIERLEKIDGIWTPLEQLMTNLQENHWSRFELHEVKYNAKIDDETFNKSHLTR